MPSQALYGRHIKEYITVEFLACKLIRVAHSHSNGVGREAALAIYTGVVAVDVVNRYIGVGSQRVIDDTLIRISELKVLTGMIVACTETEFQPRLQVGVKIGAHTEAIKLRTDNGTLLIEIRP